MNSIEFTGSALDHGADHGEMVNILVNICIETESAVYSY